VHHVGYLPESPNLGQNIFIDFHWDQFLRIHVDIKCRNNTATAAVWQEAMTTYSQLWLLPDVQSQNQYNYFSQFNAGLGALYGPLPTLLHNGYWLSPGGKAAGVWHWPPIPTQCWGSRKSRAIPLLPLWAFVACSKAIFTFINERLLDLCRYKDTPLRVCRKN
jgi:hypothetical protein